MVVTVCTATEDRIDPNFPVCRKLVPVTILNTASNGSTTVAMNGMILAVVADVPDLTGAGTLAIDIQDEDGTNIVAQKAAIAENAKSRWELVAAATPYGAIVAGNVAFKCTASAGAQTGNQLITLIIYYI